jgi:hypothetical protein
MGTGIGAAELRRAGRFWRINDRSDGEREPRALFPAAIASFSLPKLISI